MGDIETRVQKRARREKIQHIVLSSIYVASAVGMVMMAPNSVQLLKYMDKHVGTKKNLDKRIRQAAYRLADKGLLERKKTARGYFEFSLTKKGERFAESLEMIRQATRPQLKWDRKWRIIIFDVWEKRRDVRNRLREKLKAIGFVKIQDSVWVYPYPCEELFALTRTELRLGRGILYIVADEIEGDTKLRHHFNLPPES